MNRSALVTFSIALCALLIWLGLSEAHADLSPAVAPTSSATSQAANQSTGSPAQPNSIEPRYRSRGRTRETITPQPTTTTAHAMPMPGDYAVLLSRSMFVRGHIAETGHLGGHPAALNTSPVTDASLQRPETGLVFNGVTQTANTIDALVEDTSTGHVLTVHSGDSVAKGKVGTITMDELEYLSDGKVTKVQIGQNFTGGAGDVSASPAALEPSGGSMSGLSPQDILERLRQKRAHELGGK